MAGRLFVSPQCIEAGTKLHATIITLTSTIIMRISARVENTLVNTMGSITKSLLFRHQCLSWHTGPASTSERWGSVTVRTYRQHGPNLRTGRREARKLRLPNGRVAGTNLGSLICIAISARPGRKGKERKHCSTYTSCLANLVRWLSIGKVRFLKQVRHSDR